MMLIKPKDAIAIVAIIVLIGLKVYQGEGDIDALISMVVGYYFAKRQNNQDSGV